MTIDHLILKDAPELSLVDGQEDIVDFPARDYVRNEKQGEKLLRTDVRTLLKIWGVKDDGLDRACITVIEAYQNAIEHGDPDVPVRAYLQRSGIHLKVGLIMDSLANGSKGVPVEKIEEGRDVWKPGDYIRGWGHEFMRKLSDGALYTGPTVQVDLTFYFKLEKVTPWRDQHARDYLRYEPPRTLEDLRLAA